MKAERYIPPHEKFFKNHCKEIGFNLEDSDLKFTPYQAMEILFQFTQSQSEEVERNQLIEFMDDLREYVRESGTNIALDERESSEFVDIFLSQALKETKTKVGQSEQLSLSDFRVGFQYEEYQMDSERYLNKGMIWVKKTYGINSPRLHKIKKLIEEGKVRRA